MVNKSSSKKLSRSTRPRLRGQPKTPSKIRDLSDNIQEFKQNIILNTATDIFYNNGYQNTTVDEIASAMSVSKAVIYWNFKSKRELLDKIIDRAMSLHIECIDYIEKSKKPSENLAKLCFQYAARILLNQKLVAIFFLERRNFSITTRRLVAARRKILIPTFIDILEAGVASGEFQGKDTELVAYEIISMIAMASDWRWHRQSGRFSCEDLSLHFAKQALRLAGYEGEFPFAKGELKLDVLDSQNTWGDPLLTQDS